MDSVCGVTGKFSWRQHLLKRMDAITAGQVQVRERAAQLLRASATASVTTMRDGLSLFTSNPALVIFVNETSRLLSVRRVRSPLKKA